MTADQVRDLFSYDNGRLIRRYTWCRHRAGVEAGTIHVPRFGYPTCRIKYQGRNYRRAGLVWLMHHGELPSRVFHINGDSLDDRVENLTLENPRLHMTAEQYRGRLQRCHFGDRHTARPEPYFLAFGI